jgi:hypothetical protein
MTMTEESIEDVKQAYALLFKENADLRLRVATLEPKAVRYEWLKERLLGADFAWGEPSTCVWVFETNAPISADLDAAIDAALKETQ